MINLATFTKRSEFVAAYTALENEIKQLKAKLQQYEGASQTNEEAENEFLKFWKIYGCKGNKKTARKYWFNLSNKKKELAWDKVSDYVRSKPEKCYRKDGEKWIKNECWNDEIVEAAQPYGRPPAVRAQTSIIEDDKTEALRLAEAAKLRQASRGRNVRGMLK